MTPYVIKGCTCLGCQQVAQLKAQRGFDDAEQEILRREARPRCPVIPIEYALALRAVRRKS